MRRIGAVLAVLVLAACSKAEAPRGAAKPAAAPAAPAPAVVAAPATTPPPRVVADPASAPPSAPAIKLVDSTRNAERTAAIEAVTGVAGVRSAMWLDRENLRAVVEGDQAGSYETIHAICEVLAPVGDTAGVVVNVQSGSASEGGLSVVSRLCSPPADAQAAAIAPPAPPSDVVTPEIREELRAGQGLAADSAKRAEEAAESLRIIEQSTPQLPFPGSADRPPPARETPPVDESKPAEEGGR